MEFERDFHPRLSPVKKRPIRLFVRNLCLIPQSFSDCVQRRLTCFPGRDSPEVSLSDEPRAFPDSSSTGGVCCVSGRIPAFCDPKLQCTIPAGLTFSSASLHYCFGTGRYERYPFRTCHRSGMSRRFEEPFSPGCRRCLIRSGNKPFRTVLPAFTIPTRTSGLLFGQ